MGQKINPIGFRLGVNKSWKSQWCVDRQSYVDTLHEDLAIRKLIEKFPEFLNAEIADVEIIRNPQKINLIIYSARPGIVIGNKGSTIEHFTQVLQKKVNKSVNVKIKELKKAEVQAIIVANYIAKQLKNRMPFRRVMKSAVASAIRSGVLGIKIKISGRLGGAEMARDFQIKEGRVPLQTLRANIDYGLAESMTTYGVIGVKVWIFKGEIFKENGEIKDDAGRVVRGKGVKE